MCLLSNMKQSIFRFHSVPWSNAIPRAMEIIELRAGICPSRCARLKYLDIIDGREDAPRASKLFDGLIQSLSLRHPKPHPRPYPLADAANQI